MNGSGEGLSRWRKLPSSPYPWLAYLPLFATPWLFTSPPSLAALAWSAAALLPFLVLYIWGWRQRGARLIGASLGVLGLSFALSYTGGNWTVIAIYAAALGGWLRPSGHAVRFILLLTLLTGGYAFAGGIFWPWGMGAMFLMAMVGLSNVSGAALQDKTAALAAAQEEVQRLAATAERERIGRDLHDLLGRTLTLVTIKAELAAKLVPSDPVKAEVEMREVAQASREALAEVRAAVSGMTGTGFAREVEQSCTALEAAGITCTVEGAPERVDGGTGAVLAMALREAVTNVIRHSGARQCRIRIHRQGRSVELGVEDDGDGTAVREAGGIGGIRARLAAAGGSLSVEGSHSGTHLRATLPLAT